MVPQYPDTMWFPWENSSKRENAIAVEIKNWPFSQNFTTIKFFFDKIKVAGNQILHNGRPPK